ncbi:MAG: Rrf2 family transcriptional regulator [Lachnospiraceae bacterium]
MRLNTKCSIALHCLILISEYEQKIKVTSELLAKSTGCNSAAIRAILNTLQKAEIISIMRGIGGAYLNCDPKGLTVWDVYHALEPDGLEHFIGLHPHPSEQCPVGRKIRTVLEKPYREVGAAVQEAMKGITLQQLIDDYHSNNDVNFHNEP